MCGIAGWLGRAPRGDAHALLVSMGEQIAHRGPDGEGMALLPGAGLVHRRLSIVDLAGGAQPMWSAAGEALISFNGEIYNYRQLRKELEASGYRFATQSDTEVILALYLRDGPEGFAQLRGMYAFALWDERSQRGLLVRDPLGIKPLFMARQSGRVLFASEAKALLVADECRAELDEGALHLLLNFRYLPGQLSLFRGVEQVAPGAVLQWQRSELSALLQLPDSWGVESKDTDLSAGLEVIADSVRAHQVADVEVAAYLSGGIDSATVAALMQSETGALRSFTLDIGDDPDEAANAAATAKLLGLENVCYSSHLAASERLQKVIWHLEVPKINALQVDALASHVAGEVKVALSGLGGDEVFLGYNAHRLLHQQTRLQRFRYLSVPTGKLAASMLASVQRVPWSEGERAMLMAAAGSQSSRAYGLLRNLWDQPRLRRWLYGPRMLDQQLPDAFAVLEELWPRADSPLLAMREFEWQQKMVNDLLWQEDRCAMAHGLEVRTPFVDTRVKAAFWHLSPAQLMDAAQPKALLRDMVSPLLPPAVLNRPKSGFQVSAGEFYQDQLEELAAEWLSEERVKHYGLFNSTTVQQLRNLPPRTAYRWHFFILYLMLGVHLWMAGFEEGAHG
jgi:asparagine synthase (glutamine-hydrolysing)